MIIRRDPGEARNQINFALVKQSSPRLREEPLQPLFESYGEAKVGSVLSGLNQLRKDSQTQAKFARIQRDGLATISLGGLAVGTWAALSGHPTLAAAAALGVLGAGYAGLENHRKSKRFGAQAAFLEQAHQTTLSAADALAEQLVVRGPGPEQITDRRYYTSGIIKNIATVHCRETGELLRTQVELSGGQFYKLESNIAKKTLSLRSSQGDQTFTGAIELKSDGIKLSSSGQAGSNGGSLEQTIKADGSSSITLLKQLRKGFPNHISLSSSETRPKSGFLCGTYVWENGQAAKTVGDVLYVANPIIPLQGLNQEVRVLPEGVVGVESQIKDCNQASEATLPDSLGIGTWSSARVPVLTQRLVETKFGNSAFSLTADLKLDQVRITAPDGSQLESKSKVVESNKTHRLQTQHVLGTLEQSLLANEVLLNLHMDGRVLSVQHSSGEEPQATEQQDRDFLEDVRNLPVSLDAQGTYRILDGGQQIELKPFLPLSFLEKKAPLA